KQAIVSHKPHNLSRVQSMTVGWLSRPLPVRQRPSAHRALPGYASGALGWSQSIGYTLLLTRNPVSRISRDLQRTPQVRATEIDPRRQRGWKRCRLEVLVVACQTME